jgi:hypothetical protein
MKKDTLPFESPAIEVCPSKAGNLCTVSYCIAERLSNNIYCLVHYEMALRRRRFEDAIEGTE